MKSRLVVLTLAALAGLSIATVQAAPLPGCTVAQVEAGVMGCDPQAAETGSREDEDAADCSVEGQHCNSVNPEGEGAFDAGGDDGNDGLPDHG